LCADDTRYNYPAIYVAVMNNCAGAQIIFESSSGTFSQVGTAASLPPPWVICPPTPSASIFQTLNLPVTTLLGAYLRLEYNAGLGKWTARYRQSVASSWLSFSAINIGSSFGGAFTNAQTRVGFFAKNWSGRRGFHYFTYLAIGSNVCASAGCVRVLPAPATSAIITGLQPSTAYAITTTGVSQWGPGASSAVSTTATTLAPSVLPRVPLFNVALNKPARNINNWCTAAPVVCSVASYGELRCSGQRGPGGDSTFRTPPHVQATTATRRRTRTSTCRGP